MIILTSETTVASLFGVVLIARPAFLFGHIEQHESVRAGEGMLAPDEAQTKVSSRQNAS